MKQGFPFNFSKSLCYYVIRSAWKTRYKFFAVIIIAAFSFAVYVGTFSAIKSLFSSRDMWYSHGNMADLELKFGTDDSLNMPNFRRLPYICDMQERMVFPGTLILSVGNTFRTLVITNKENMNRINRIKLLSGSFLSKNDKTGVLVERSFDKYHPIKMGQQLTIRLGKEDFIVHVRGIVTSPEFLLAPVNPSLFLPTKGSLAVIYADPSLFSSRFGYDITNSVLFKFKDKTNLEYARDNILKLAKERLNVDWTISRIEQFSYLFLEKDLSVFKTIIPVITLSTFLSSLVVTIFIFFQWILGERQCLSTFMMLGFSAKAISKVILSMTLFLGIIAILIGIPLAALILKGFAINFAHSIGFPDPILRVDIVYLIIGALLILSIFTLSGFIALRKILNMTPRDAGNVHKSNTSYIDFITNSYYVFPVWLRFALRNILRYPKETLTSIMAVALGFGITVSFFISLSSFINSSIKNVSKDHWNLVVDFGAPVWQENLSLYRNLSFITQINSYTKGVVQAVTKEGRHNLYVAGIESSFQPMRVLNMVQGRNLQSNDFNSILLERGIARDLNLKTGDKFDIEANGKTYEVNLVGVFSGVLPGEAYMPINFHREIAELTERSTGLFLKVAGNIQTIMTSLYKQSDVQHVLSKAQITDDIMQASGEVTRIIVMGAAVSTIIALLFIYGCVTHRVMRIKHEYTTLRLLGYQNYIIAGIVLTEIILVGVISLVLAIPVGYLGARYLNYQLSEQWFKINTVFDLKDYFAISIPGLLLMPLPAIPIFCSIIKDPLTSLVKERWKI
jgi:putative ABC transport system permease protein